MNHVQTAPHRFSNYRNVIDQADPNWATAEGGRICGLNVELSLSNQMSDQYGRTLHHFCTTSYLGLDNHPDLLDGAMSTLWETGTLRIANSRNRCQLAILQQYENELSQLFGAECLTTLSCSAASAGILPLLASGAFTDQRPPVMVFDKHAHYSMNHIKAACADETRVLTGPHNDMDWLEDRCREHPRVAYVADGAYSMGGVTDLDSLLYLKQRYGLFLYLDDSHALSAVGTSGAGYVRPRLQRLDDEVLIVASLAKAFGASGGVVMFASEQQKKIVQRYGGPSNWSQSLNAAAIGAGRASVRLHHSSEFLTLQNRLQSNLQLFDSLLRSEQHGSCMAIRLIPCGDAALANSVAIQLADHGFFTSAVFFPVVPRDKAAIRITLRADMEADTIQRFCTLLSGLLQERGRNISG